MSEMTFRGLEILDLGIMARVGVRKVGEIDGLEESNWEEWAKHVRGGTSARAEHRRSGDPGLWVRHKSNYKDGRVIVYALTNIHVPVRRELVWI